MLVPVSSQAYIFLCTVIGGMLVGFVYDIFRVSRKMLKTKNIIVYFEDVIFWLLVGLLTFFVLFASNAGQIRGYAFVGLVLGIIIYAFLISYYVVRSLVKGIEITVRFIVKLYKIISLPIIFIMKILYLPISYISKGFRKLKSVFSKISDKVLAKVKLNIRNLKVRFKKI